MKKTISLLTGLLCLLSHAYGVEPAITQEEKRILELTPAVVLVVVSYHIQLAIPRENADPLIKNYTYTATGTGFLYRPDGYIITNGHVVADANVKDKQAQEARARRILDSVVGKLEEEIGHKLTDADRDYVAARTKASTPTIVVMLANRSSYNGEIKQYSDPTGVNSGKDVAIIKIDGNNLPTVRLGDSSQVYVQEPITAIGYPGAASPIDLPVISQESLVVPTVTNGHVSAIKMDYKGTPVIQADAAITHGNSGGPAFDPDGKVIGIATYGSSGEVAGFNFFVPINTALEFVRQAGAPPQSGAFDVAWAQALDAYQARKWETARGLLTDVLGLMPNAPDAARLQPIAAQHARDQSPVDRVIESMQGGWWIWGAGGLAVVMALLLGVWLMARSRKPAPVLAVAGGPPALSPGGQAAVLPPAPVAERIYGTLHVTAGALNGNRFPIPKAGLKIGRDSTKCNVVIPDDSVSKEHAWIVPVDHDVVVIDRDSSNGTYVNSTDSPRVSKVVLRHGDRIYIGRKGTAVLTYHSS